MAQQRKGHWSCKMQSVINWEKGNWLTLAAAACSDGWMKTNQTSFLFNMEKEGREREEKQSDYYISICLSSDLFLYGNVEPTGLLLLLLPIVKSSGRWKSSDANGGDTKSERRSWRKKAVYCCCCFCSGRTLSLGKAISHRSTAASLHKESNGVGQQLYCSTLDKSSCSSQRDGKGDRPPPANNFS